MTPGSEEEREVAALTIDIMSKFSGKSNAVVSAALFAALATVMYRSGKTLSEYFSTMETWDWEKGGENGGKQPTAQ